MTVVPGGQPSSSFARRAAPRLLISLLVAGGFVWAMHRGGLPFAPPAHASAALRWWAVPAFVVLALVGFYFRTVRWIYLLRPISPRVPALATFAIGLIGGGATFFAPFRLGEMVRPYLLAKESKDVTFTQALGTVAAERTVDGLLVVLLTTSTLALSTPISPLPDHLGKLPIPIRLVPGALLSATVLFSMAFAVLLGLYLLRERAGSLIRGTLGRLSPTLAERIALTVERVALGLAFMSNWRAARAVLLSTAGFWISTMGATWALLRGVGLPASLTQGCMIGGLMSLGSILPAGPGFFGAYQVSAYTALAMYYPAEQVVSLGALFVFAGYVSVVAINAITAVLGFVMLERSR